MSETNCIQYAVLYSERKRADLHISSFSAKRYSVMRKLSASWTDVAQTKVTRRGGIVPTWSETH